MSVNARLTGMSADVNSVELSWGFGNPDGTAPAVSGPNGEDWRPMEPNPSLGPGEYVLNDIPFGEVVLGWGLTSNTEHVITIAVRALDAAGNELAMNRDTIRFQPCALPEDYSEGTLYLHGVLRPETVWQCPEDPDAALAHISAELFDPSNTVSRVVATNRLVSAAGANSGSQSAIELTRSSVRTPAGGWYYSGILDTRLYDFSRLTDLEYGLQVTLQALDASGNPVYEAGPYSIRFRIDCYTDDSAGAGEGKPDEVTPTPEPQGPKTFILSRDAVCRAGPSLDYKISEYIAAGASVPVQARSEDSGWLAVLLPNGVRCWVGIKLGTLDGNPNQLPTEKAPELFVPPTKTSGGQQGGGNPVDADGDGYTSDADCNDGSNKINPGAYEYPNDGTDSNCNGDDNS